MDPDLVRALLLCGAFTALVWTLVSIVRYARRGGKAVKSFGMAMMLFGWGHMRDPRNDTVAEAQDGRIRRDAESGAPPAN